jgi:hypothetical protein
MGPSSIHKKDETGIHVPYKEEILSPMSFEQAEGHETMSHVPGQWFPQANNIEHYELYCASMLNLFSTSFNNFIMHTPESIARIFTNMQYFHDCSDKA